MTRAPADRLDLAILTTYASAVACVLAAVTLGGCEKEAVPYAKQYPTPTELPAVTGTSAYAGPGRRDRFSKRGPGEGTG